MDKLKKNQTKRQQQQQSSIIRDVTLQNQRIIIFIYFRLLVSSINILCLEAHLIMYMCYVCSQYVYARVWRQHQHEYREKENECRNNLRIPVVELKWNGQLFIVLRCSLPLLHSVTFQMNILDRGIKPSLLSTTVYLFIHFLSSLEKKKQTLQYTQSIPTRPEQKISQFCSIS